MQIGFIGVGLMGQGMVTSLLRHGHKVRVIAHRARPPIDAVVAQGAEEVASLSGLVRGAEIVMTCVTNSKIVEDLVGRMKPDLERGQILIDTSTAHPQSTRAIARELEPIGVHLADAPMTGGPEQTLTGEAGTLVGAEDRVFETIRPVLACYCSTIRHMGPVGTGHTAKLASNYLSCGMVALIADAYNTARRAGIDWAKLYDVMLAGATNSGALRKMIGPALGGDFDGYRFSIGNAAKDLGYYCEVAEGLGRLTPLAATTRAVLASAAAAGHAGENVSRLIDPKLADQRR